jgi:hypothetical protein
MFVQIFEIIPAMLFKQKRLRLKYNKIWQTDFHSLKTNINAKRYEMSQKETYDLDKISNLFDSLNFTKMDID